MKLFVSALFAAFVPLAVAQNQAPTGGAAVSGMSGFQMDSPSSAAAQAQLDAQLQAWQGLAAAQAACPLQLTSASVAPSAGLLPVGMRNSGDGALALHFRNQSGKAIRSASITAHLKVKTNVYALDARPLEVQLTFSGTEDRDRQADQLARIALPGRVYLFGVVTVSLDQVTFADGSFWIATPGTDVCKVGGAGTQLLEAK